MLSNLYSLMRICRGLSSLSRCSLFSLSSILFSKIIILPFSDSDFREPRLLNSRQVSASDSLTFTTFRGNYIIPTIPEVKLTGYRLRAIYKAGPNNLTIAISTVTYSMYTVHLMIDQGQIFDFMRNFICTRNKVRTLLACNQAICSPKIQTNVLRFSENIICARAGFR